MTLAMPTYRKLLSGVMSGLSLGTHPLNLKFVPLAVLELLAFNSPKFTGSRDRDHAHFSERFGATEKAGMENAGLENVGPNCRGGNSRIGKCRTKFAGMEKAGLENTGT